VRDQDAVALAKGFARCVDEDVMPTDFYKMAFISPDL